MAREDKSRFDEAVRMLAAAASAARLYPAQSPLPAEAVSRFVQFVHEILRTLDQPLRFTIDARGLYLGEEQLAVGSTQVLHLAQNLHAMQIGQMIIAPGLEAGEVTNFLEALSADPTEIREAGGLRSSLIAAGTEHLAVIEVSLRAASEAGLTGLDLTNASLHDIGIEAFAAAEEWAGGAETGSAEDSMAQAIDGLEQAAREMAMGRVAEALLQLPESTRTRLFENAMKTDASGAQMEGMLKVIGRMKPAALARLLTIVAAQIGSEPSSLAGSLDLPPEVAEQVALLLAPSPRSETDCGVPETVDVVDMANDMAVEDDRDALERQIASSAPLLAAGRALSTAVALAREHPDPDTIAAMGDALPRAVEVGAFPAIREALRRLDELSGQPDLADTVRAARSTIARPEVLAAVCRAPRDDADAAIAGEILSSAGPAGATALLDCFTQASAPTRSLLKPVLRTMSEAVLGVASRRLRSDDPRAAIGVLKVLPALGDSRATPVIGQALDHLDIEVRRATVTALGEAGDATAIAALTKAVNHWDPETQRYTVREIGRMKVIEAVPSMLRVLDDINVFDRKHELKKEIIKSFEALGSSDALPALRRIAQRKIALGRKSKELRLLAIRAVAHLESVERSAPHPEAPSGGVDSRG